MFSTMMENFFTFHIPTKHGENFDAHNITLCSKYVIHDVMPSL